MSYDFKSHSELIKENDWRVTRSLVSYDHSPLSPKGFNSIEGSPDHWWVTTTDYLLNLFAKIEGSPDHWWVTTQIGKAPSLWRNWRVTRSLVSYDSGLEGLQDFELIEGSPDHWWVTTSGLSLTICTSLLKGHQIIGELRHRELIRIAWLNKLKGHQIIGELRPFRK